jgi:hypothetical protein
MRPGVRDLLKNKILEKGNARLAGVTPVETKVVLSDPETQAGIYHAFSSAVS